jgi:serine/threonine protein kinase
MVISAGYAHDIHPIKVLKLIDVFKANILVDEGQHALLADFGLIGWTITAGSGGTTYGRGSYRWMAPELLDPSIDGSGAFIRTPATDVYAFACTSIEVSSKCADNRIHGLMLDAGLHSKTAFRTHRE